MPHPVFRIGLGVMVAAGTLALMGGAGPAQALTAQECSAKYQAAQKAGTLNGMKWNDFRKAQCGAGTTSAATSTVPNPAHPAPSAAGASATGAVTPTKPSAQSSASAAAGTKIPSNAVFPTSVAPKYSQESAGKARMHTCLDQYNANKATNANGGLTWIQKGGGYYALCNQRLKG